MEAKALSIGDTELAYVEQGTGIPIVFVHGAGGDWRTFDPLREFIAPKYRYISYSRRYHYPNAWSDQGQQYTILQHAQDLVDLIRALRLPKVHLVGGSYGGRIAAWFALNYPGLLRSVTFSEPGLVDGDSLAAGAAVASWNADIAGMVSSLRAGDLRRATIGFFDAVLGFKGAFERLPAGRQQNGLDNARTFGPMLSSPKVPPGPPQQWGEIDVPVLLMHGQYTRAYFWQSNYRLLEYLPPGTSTAVVPDAPHLWYPVSPEKGAQAILDFADSH
ncbi:alpha/beta fold hydrolase [Undibacterium terreum]|uniref:AB hydrolase-1 domain-containing protein n=1 Tax=Undibacterium terreum TaxID=1224302 RepID=A0A916UCK7_9BURK|nr:alpha/beta hydrolase [Undibacterium terreum]GGC66905.1 hypothetical protein GCM10011396_12400 [Undibacterium terreum]